MPPAAIQVHHSTENQQKGTQMKPFTVIWLDRDTEEVSFSRVRAIDAQDAAEASANYHHGHAFIALLEGHIDQLQVKLPL